MAIPAILGVAARKTVGIAASGAKLAGRGAYAALRGSVAAQRNTVLDRTFNAGEGLVTSYLAKKREKDDDNSNKKSSAPSSNQEKAEQDEQKNRERQNKAQDDAMQKGEESTSVLRVISKDTKDILAGIELLVEEGMPLNDKDKKGGLLGSLISLIGGLSMFSKGLLPALGRSLLAIAPKLGGMLARSMAGMLSSIAKMGGGVLKAAGSVGKAAVVAGGALASRGALAGRGAIGGMSAAAKAGGTVTGMAAKAAGKSALKKIPIIGAGVGLALAANRASAGDFVGAGMETASGLLSVVPGLGTAASLGVDAAILARDMKRHKKGGAVTGSTDNSTLSPVESGNVEDVQVGRSSVEIALESMMWTLRTMLSNMISPDKGIYTRAADDKMSLEDITRFSSSQPEINEPASQTQSTLTPLPGHTGLGDLSARYESGTRGSHAVGWDSTGGTSYGKYQIATRTGTMDKFMEYLKTADPETFQRLQAAGPADTGKDGVFAKTWRQLASEGKLGDHEHAFIKKTHYEPGMAALKSDSLRGMIGKSASLQDVMWSTTVQHGANRGAGIFDKVYKEGMTEEDLINAIYNERGTRFGSSSASVRASVLDRFQTERRQALAMSGRNPDQPISAQVRESVVNQSAVARAPVVVSAPTVVNQTSKGGGGGGSGMAPAARMVIRNPDGPIGIHAMVLMGIT